jgi:type I restriction enzyme S subunit
MSDTVFPDTMIAARVDTKRTDLSFLQSQWETQHVRHQILQGARTTNGTYKINQQVISNIRLIVPPFPSQADFGKCVETVRNVLAAQEHASVEASLAFDSLVQRAFNGAL